MASQPKPYATTISLSKMPNPVIKPLSDDRDKALACVNDIHVFCQKFRVGLFARRTDHLFATLSEPYGAGGLKWPPRYRDVTEWRDLQNIDMLRSHELIPVGISDLRVLEALHAIGQALHYYDSALIPSPIAGESEPMLVLCDSLPGGMWRAYSVVAELNCYTWKERSVKPKLQ